MTETGLENFLRNSAEALGLKQEDPTACADEGVSVAAAGHPTGFLDSSAHTPAGCQLSGLNRHGSGDNCQR